MKPCPRREGPASARARRSRGLLGLALGAWLLLSPAAAFGLSADLATVDPDLTLHGLRILHDRNRKR